MAENRCLNCLYWDKENTNAGWYCKVEEYNYSDEIKMCCDFAFDEIYEEADIDEQY